jgi:SAM-dependent methyltransferase
MGRAAARRRHRLMYNRSMRVFGMTFRRRVALAVCVCLASLVSPGPPAQGQTAAPSQEPQRKTSTPYSGDLSIFDYPDREKKLHINQVMDLLVIVPGKTVADIGAGSGWFTVRAARRVTDTGKVYAVDINPAAIQFIESRAKKEALPNIDTVLGSAGDPRLPPSSVDAVLLLKTYHEVAKPVELLRNLRSALRPGARVGIIDRNGNGENHGVEKKVVIEEAQSAGYRLVGEHDNLVKDDRMDYFLIFVAQ